MKFITEKYDCTNGLEQLRIDIRSIECGGSLYTWEKIVSVEYAVAIREENYMCNDIDFVEDVVVFSLGAWKELLDTSDKVISNMEYALFNPDSMSAKLIMGILNGINWWEQQQCRRALWVETRDGLKCTLPDKKSIWIDNYVCKINEQEGRKLAMNFSTPLGVVPF